jgi:MoxR-like ATPase
VLELVLVGVLASGHVLLEDLPGLGKTLMARSFATVLGLDFTRVQFTPDLLPSDLTGAAVYDQRSGELVFRPGPVFTEHPARRRGQPHAAEDAGRATRGHG